MGVLNSKYVLNLSDYFKGKPINQPNKQVRTSVVILSKQLADLSLIFQMYLYGISKYNAGSLQILPFVPLKYAKHFVSDRTNCFIGRKGTLEERGLY